MNPILITIDVEECDIPLEYGLTIPLEEQLAVSKEGLAHFMQIVEEAGVPVTIFCTGVYAENNPDWVKSLHSMHELASHGYFHGHFDASKDLPNSKKLLEKFQKGQLSDAA